MGNVEIHTTLIKYIFIFHYIIPHITTKHSYVISKYIQINLKAIATNTAAAAAIVAATVYNASILFVWHVFYNTREK